MKGPPEFLGCLPTQIFPDSGRQIRRNLEIRRVHQVNAVVSSIDFLAIFFFQSDRG